MQLVFEKESLSSALDKLQGVANARSTLPILANLMIQADEDGVTISATNLEIGIRMAVDGIIDEQGSATVNAKKLFTLVKELDSEGLRLTKDENERITLESGSGKYTLIGMPYDEYPQLVKLEGEPATIDGVQFVSSIQKTLFASSTEEARYFLNGVHYHFHDDKTVVVATDGRQLSLTEIIPLQLDGLPDEKDGIIVPRTTLLEIVKIFEGSETVDIVLSESQIMISDDRCRLTSRLIEGEFPKYEAIIPNAEEMEGYAEFNRVELLRATQRVSLLSNPKNFSICYDINSDLESIIVSTNSPDIGSASEKVGVVDMSGDVRIGFDSRLIISALQHIDSEHVRMIYSEPLKPLVMKPVGSDDDTHRCLAMPMRLSHE